MFALQHLNPGYTTITRPPMFKGEGVLTHGWKSPASACGPPSKSSAHSGLPVAMDDAGRRGGERAASARAGGGWQGEEEGP